MAAVAFTFLITACRVERHEPAPDIEGARLGVQAMLDHGAATWNAGDLDGFISDYVADATFVTGRGVIRGADSIKARYGPRFAPGGVRDSLVFRDLQVDLLGPDVANAIATWVLMRGDSVTSSGPTSLVVRKVEGRWRIVGGMVVQPDCNLPAGESFERQLRYGQRCFRELVGATATVGYNVDSFGHDAYLPRALRGAGMDAYVFMRPGPGEKELPCPAFRWRAPDGCEVAAFRICGGYSAWDPEFPGHVRRAAESARPAAFEGRPSSRTIPAPAARARAVRCPSNARPSPCRCQRRATLRLSRCASPAAVMTTP